MVKKPKRSRQWKQLNSFKSPVRHFIILDLPGVGQVPLRDATIPARRVIIFKCTDLAKQCYEHLLDTSASFNETLDGFVASMGQEKWELFQDEQVWVLCESMEQFHKIESAKQKLAAQLQNSHNN